MLADQGSVLTTTVKQARSLEGMVAAKARLTSCHVMQCSKPFWIVCFKVCTAHQWLQACAHELRQQCAALPCTALPGFSMGTTCNSKQQEHLGQYSGSKTVWRLLVVPGSCMVSLAVHTGTQLCVHAHLQPCLHVDTCLKHECLTQVCCFLRVCQQMLQCTLHHPRGVGLTRVDTCCRTTATQGQGRLGAETWKRRH